MKIEYFGTDLKSPGHRFWLVEGESLIRSDRKFDDLPFNPENLPAGDKNRSIQKGYVEFRQESGFTIMAIAGSCSDSRGGAKSIFFVTEILSREEMLKAMKSIPAVVEIIDAMPFEVWDNLNHNPDDTFKLEHQYQLYIKRVGLDEHRMHPQQKKQLRETFMGACGQMIILLRDDVSALPEDEGVKVLQDMLNEVGDHFLKESGKQN